MNVSSVVALLGLAMGLVFMLTMGLAVGLAVAVNVAKRIERALAPHAAADPRTHADYRPAHGSQTRGAPLPPSYPPVPYPATDRAGGMVRPREGAPSYA
jgi:hypothetical protein